MPPVLRATRDGAELHLEWDGPARLETDDLPNGPWRTLDAGTNPFQTVMTNAQAYFRLNQ